MTFTTVMIPHPGAVITGTWLSDDANATGSVYYFPPTTTNSIGLAYVTNGRYYANWNSSVRWNTLCGQTSTQSSYFMNVEPELGIGWVCAVAPSETGPADTHFALQESVPSAVTVYSYGGSPLSLSASTSLYEYNRAGTLLNVLSASSIASDGSSATFPFPDNRNGSALSPDIYGLSLVQNSSTVNGLGWIAIAGSQTIAGNPFGVAAAGQTDGWEDRDTCDRTETSGSSYSSFPVVSLYSSNQVLVNGNTVSVGASPTAVAVFSGAPVRTTTNDSCDSYRDTISGMTQAIVTNSGGNTVSILDLVNDVRLEDVTVGNQPVAVVVSSDGSTAYVANYGSGTISVISLSTLKETATISVGGSPLSLTLDNNGNLWVGGTKSLSQVELSSGQVANSIAMPGPVTSLAYSYAQAELIATSVQTSGSIQANVYPYVNLVSSSNTPPPLLTNAAGYSADYVSASSRLIGIPNPVAISTATLVSNDSQNSLTVSATSTGFIVTDLGLKEVIMQGTTPGPVVSIAVDPLNHVAYMTVPSQNLLITLPLPPSTLN